MHPAVVNYMAEQVRVGAAELDAYARGLFARSSITVTRSHWSLRRLHTEQAIAMGWPRSGVLVSRLDPGFWEQQARRGAAPRWRYRA